MGHTLTHDYLCIG